ncbi:MAG: leucyl aminopeptidase [Acidobacteria bacterium]|nr:leucyl aminopeptidase [Acidobacteriota bacterium]MBI3654998.1 leucyl aminopeptidase [Acidobacteriota bacterium]
MKVTFSYKPISALEADLLVVILDESKTLHDVDALAVQRAIERARRLYQEKRLKREYVTNLDHDAKIPTFILFSTSLNKNYPLGEVVKIFVARALQLAKDFQYRRVAVVMNSSEAQPFVGAVIEGALLGAYTFDKYRTEKNLFFKEVHLEIVGHESDKATNQAVLRRFGAVSEAVNDCRTLVNEPGAEVYPQVMAEVAAKIAKARALKCRILDEKELQKQGYNGLIAVGRGSQHPPRLITLRYRPAKPSRHTLALVGKGITFDTGGISIKPADKMFEMKGDMAGGGAVLYAMQAIGQLKPTINVVGIVPTAENFPDALAQRPGDIFYAKNGKSIMVDNTDAEGRLILTDGLYTAGEQKATHIVDIATLTGSCVRALGHGAAGILGTSQALAGAVKRAGEAQGEVFWELPLIEEYRDMLKTPYADINNVGGTVAGAITAALFLREFVPKDTPWVHLDIAGPFMLDKEWKYYDPGATGFGVKTLVDLCEHFEEYLGE